MPHKQTIENLHSLICGEPGSQPEDADECLYAILDAWNLAPVELGIPMKDQQVLKDKHQHLRGFWQSGQDEPVNTVIGILMVWLELCFSSIDHLVDHRQELLVSLRKGGSIPEWEPAQAWLFRAMAALGDRSGIAGLLHDAPPFSLPQIEASLEANLPVDRRIALTALLRQPEAIVTRFPQELVTRWKQLLFTELDLFETPDSAGIETSLLHLLEYPDVDEQLPWLTAEHRRISARAASALVRLRLQQGSPIIILDNPVFQALPEWEQETLAGLLSFQSGNPLAALQHLETANKLSSWQTIIHQALASAWDCTDTGKALQYLPATSPTHHIAVSQAALLARAGRFDESAAVLETCAGMPRDAIRWSSLSEEKLVDLQEQQLNIAHLTRQGKSSEVDNALNSALTGGENRMQRLCRSAFAAWYVSDRDLIENSWQVDQLHRKVQRAIGTLSRETRADDPEFTFYQAVLLMEKEQEKAVKLIESLIQSLEWIDSQCRAGGSRLLYLVDESIEAGLPNLAINIYEAVSERDAGHPLISKIKARLSLANLLVIAQSKPADDEDAVKWVEIENLLETLAVSDFASDVAMLLAVSAVLFGALPGAQEASIDGRSLAQEYLQKACQLGADERACKALEQLSNGGGIAGTAFDMPKEELVDLPEPLRLAYELASARDLDKSEPDITELDRILRQFILKYGSRWADVSPVDAEWVLNSIISTALAKGSWDMAMHWALVLDQIHRQDGDGTNKAAPDAVLRLRILQAVEAAMKGDCDRALSELTRLEQPGLRQVILPREVAF